MIKTRDLDAWLSDVQIRCVVSKNSGSACQDQPRATCTQISRIRETVDKGRLILQIVTLVCAMIDARMQR